jgi:hypothetical protein
MDLVDLEEQAARGSGAVRLWGGAYETARAKRAGQTIALEAAVKGSPAAGIRSPQ